MPQIIGKYELISNSPETENWLRATGASEEVIKHILSAKTTVTLTEAGGTWTTLTLTDGVPVSTVFRDREGFEEATAQGVVYKSVPRWEGHTLIIESLLPDGGKAIRVYEFTEDGVVSTVGMEHGPKATRTYKRL